MKKASGKSFVIVAASILLVLLYIFTIMFYRIYRRLDNIKTNTIDISNKELKINERTYEKSVENSISNILLLGIDIEENASDSIIIVSIDDRNKIIKLCSIMRDSYIYFGEGKINKINYAYHYGGPVLAIKTVNENYDLDIKHYVKVNFQQLVNIVDAIGGIEIKLKEEELPYLGNTQKNIGINKLNGMEALNYSRIRRVGNGDYERTQRQRIVLQAIFNKVKELPITKYEALLEEICSSIETSLDKLTMLSLSQKIIGYGKNKIEETRVPYDDLKYDDYIDDIYYLRWDKKKSIQRLHEFIYNEDSKNLKGEEKPY